MADKWPLANGVWSNAANWNSGTLPLVGDDVYADGKVVTIDQNVTVLTIRNRQRAGGTAGGGFILSGGVTVTVTDAYYPLLITGSTLMTYSAASPAVSTLNGDWLSPTLTSTPTDGAVLTFSGTGTLNTSGVINRNLVNYNNGVRPYLISSTGTWNHTGNIFTCTNQVAGFELIRITGAATVSITGNIGLNTGAFNQSCPVIIIAAGANVTVVGNVVGAQLTATHGISMTAATATLNITGTISGNNSNAASYGVQTTNGTLNVIGTIQAVASPAINSSATAATAVTLTGPFVSGANGIFPLFVAQMKLNPIASNYLEFRNNSSTPGVAVRFFSADSIVGVPATSDVRFGTIYGNGNLTGTLRVPSANSVAFGVLVDNTSGNAVLTPDAAADATWNRLTSQITTAGSIGERLKNAATVDTTGAQIAAYDV